VIKVFDTDKTEVALKRMVRAGVQMVAVVNKDGQLVGNMSASDYRGLKSSEFSLFQEPVGKFITRNNPKSTKPVSLKKEDASLLAVLEAIVSNKVHGLYIVDNGKPIGQVSFTNIFYTVFHATAADGPKPTTNCPLPGALSVTVDRATDLTAPITHVTVEMDGSGRKADSTPSDYGATVEPVFDHTKSTFKFNLTDETLKYNKGKPAELKFTLMNDKEEYTTVTISSSWIVAGFGTDNPSNVVYQEGEFHLAANKGWLVLSMAYEAGKENLV
jgi:CBS domain-containing protein